jgi:hypothetical protein
MKDVNVVVTVRVPDGTDDHDVPYEVDTVLKSHLDSSETWTVVDVELTQ